MFIKLKVEIIYLHINHKDYLKIYKKTPDLERFMYLKYSLYETGMTSPRNMSPHNYDSTSTGPQRLFPRPQPFPTRPLSSGPDAVKAAAVAAGA